MNLHRTSASLFSLGIALALGFATTAQAQSISGISATNQSSGDEEAGFWDTTNFERESQVNILSQSSSGFSSRYKWVLGADSNVYTSREESMTNGYRVNFSVTAPGGYRLVVNTAWRGAMTTVSDSSKGKARVDVSGLSGSSSAGSITSGSLNFSDPGSIGSTKNTTNVGWDKSDTVVIEGFSGGSAVAHQLSFQWSSNCKSQGKGGWRGYSGDECAVRGGKTIDYGNESAGDYPGQGGRTQSQDGHFITVTIESLCGNGDLDSGEQCDLGGANGAANSCCTDTCQYRGAGETCGSASGACEIAAVCSGSSATCGSNTLRDSSHVCRDQDGGCDVIETCDGVNPDCPADGFATGGVCRPSLGICDTPEVCSGGRECPADEKQGGDVQCSDAPGACGLPAFCTGSSNDCPANPYKSSSFVCRNGFGAPNGGSECDPAETCTGSSYDCPADVFSSSTCRQGSEDMCDPRETCPGTAGGVCPSDVRLDEGTVCREGSEDVCDPDETCPGTAQGACPADEVKGSDYVCRSGSSEPDGEFQCDPAETCPGVAGQGCPDDTVAAAGTTCRDGSEDPTGSGMVCDPEEQCSGVAGESCPADDRKGPDVVCREGSQDACDPDETCPGTAQGACPADDFKDSDYVCREGSDEPEGEFQCDPSETCTGQAGDACPDDIVQQVGTICRAGSEDPNNSGVVCDPDEQCSGTAGEACPADFVEEAGTLCRAGSNECNASESCSGTAGEPCAEDSVYEDATACFTGFGIADDHNPQSTEELPCGAGECVCIDGSCAGPGQTFLNVGKAFIKSAKATSDTGKISIQGLVFDDETDGSLPSDLMDGKISLKVSDGSGTAEKSLTIDGCTRKGSGNSVSCKSGDIKASFKEVRGLAMTYTFKVDVKGLSADDVGSGGLTPPIAVELWRGQNTDFFRVSLAGQIGNDSRDASKPACKVSRGGRTLRCKAPKDAN